MLEANSSTVAPRTACSASVEYECKERRKSWTCEKNGWVGKIKRKNAKYSGVKCSPEWKSKVLFIGRSASRARGTFSIWRSFCRDTPSIKLVASRQDASLARGPEIMNQQARQRMISLDHSVLEAGAPAA